MNKETLLSTNPHPEEGYVKTKLTIGSLYDSYNDFSFLKTTYYGLYKSVGSLSNSDVYTTLCVFEYPIVEDVPQLQIYCTYPFYYKDVKYQNEQLISYPYTEIWDWSNMVGQTVEVWIYDPTKVNYTVSNTIPDYAYIV